MNNIPPIIFLFGFLLAAVGAALCLVGLIAHMLLVGQRLPVWSVAVVFGLLVGTGWVWYFNDGDSNSSMGMMLGPVVGSATAVLTALLFLSIRYHCHPRQ